jgi:formate hydrogenlyase subunit 3/multisubunit Na+/H+ antiporter MnhD subunit
MNAVAIWIALPLLVAGILLFVYDGRAIAIAGGTLCVLLAAIAFFVPVDVAMRFGPLSMKIAPSFQILGRQLVLGPEFQRLLTLVYAMAALWFFGAHEAGVARRMVPIGMAILALLIASLAVEPFLFAALLIEVVILLSVPMLVPPDQVPGRGVMRFIVYQSLAMPFILIAGWLLAGVEASPGDLTLAIEIASLLGMGFAFLLAIFPLYTWILLLLDESSPYIVGFLLWLLPLTTLMFGMSFLDRYTFLRTSAILLEALRMAGFVMLVSGGVLAAFENQIARLMGYAAISNTGLCLLAISLQNSIGIAIFFVLAAPQALGLATWALSLSVFAHNQTMGGTQVRRLQGLARTYPFAAAGLVVAGLSASAFPLLAGFAPRLALWQTLARVSILDAFWVGIGLAGLMLATIRTMITLVQAPPETPWVSNETWIQRILIGAGVVFLFLIGVLPQLTNPLTQNLPFIFEHLGR